MDMGNDVDSSALEQIIGDMDDMETKRVYGDKPSPAEGVSITIDVAPKAPEAKKEEEPEMMSKGGMVETPEDESRMPPFLRKRK